MSGPVNQRTIFSVGGLSWTEVERTDEPALAYTEYRFDCPECGVTNDCGSKDPTGRTLNCLHCQARVEVR